MGSIKAPPAGEGLGVFLITQQLLEATAVVVEKVARHAIVLRVFVSDLGETSAIELDDPGVRIREQDRGVRRNHELRRRLDKLMDGPERSHLAIWRQGGLGLIEQIDTVAAEL